MSIYHKNGFYGKMFIIDNPNFRFCQSDLIINSRTFSSILSIFITQTDFGGIAIRVVSLVNENHDLQFPKAAERDNS